MNNHTASRISIILLLLASGTLFSCNDSKRAGKGDKDPLFSEELAREISFVTNGDVEPDQKIQVVFNSHVVEESEIESSPDGVFIFSPSIKGRAVWVSRSVLEFLPDNPLPVRTEIAGKLKLTRLSEDFEQKKLEDLVFRLNVVGREILKFNGSIDLKDRNEPATLLYRGSVSFNQKTGLEELQKASRIRGGKDITLTWSKVDDTNFQFTSSDIVRTDNNQNFTIYIDSKPLDLEYDFSEDFVVSPLMKMTANEFRTDEAGRSPRIRVVFSDELDMDQNIDGLVNIKPEVKFEVKKLGKAVILDGNFRFGQKYMVTIQKGIASRWGIKTENIVSREVQFSDITPQIEFASDGIILPSSNKKRIQFYTTNLKRVHLEVKKVYTNHIGRFVESEQLSSTKTRNRPFNDSYASSVGVIVKNQTIDLGGETNEWLLNEFDLSDLFSKYDDGLFIIRINFTPEDMSLPVKDNLLDYIRDKGQIYKPVFLSNLGMTVKNSDAETMVFVTDIITGKPRPSVSVSLLDWEGEKVNTSVTNSQGLAVFKTDRYFYYVLAEEGRQVTVLNRNEMRWSNSGFDIGGVSLSNRGTKGFIYTERGVYRPGDSVNIGFIVKNSDNTFPKDHPVNITVSDPQYRTVYERNSVKSTDGFYLFGFATEESDPTGTYNISINAGGSWFSKELKIETVVAEQLKVLVKTLKKPIVWSDKSVDFELNVSYLFGAPASNLKTEVDVEVSSYQMSFPNYSGYIFRRSDLEFNSFTQSVLKKELDASGKLTGSWVVPPLGTVPSALRLKLIARVLDKSGQPNEGWTTTEMHVYPNYAGLRDPSGYGYYKTGEEVRFPVILLNTNGVKVAGSQLQYRIYRNDKSWWYQYNNRRNYQLKYKEDNQTYLEKEGSVSLSDGSGYISFTPSDNGEYLIEVSDGGAGHSASLFFSAYQYGSVPGGDMNEGSLALKSDKAKYASSETAKIMLPNPKQGNILVTLERGRQLLNWFWVDPSRSSADELIIDIPLNRNMLPNVYVTVSVIQPHDQTINDRPIRMFGIIPLMVEDDDTKIEFNIETPESLVPNKDFEVRLSTVNQKKAQFTIAIVDEGLLSLTQFRTPRPWSEFYKKVGLFVESYDVFAHIISANKGDIFQTFSIGGADEMDYRESQLDPVDGARRFIPVSMFKGPLFTDDRGNAVVKFRMPEYNGAVRIMVVATDRGSFGHAEKTVPVRSDIIMQPGIPRILSPGDEFFLPVSLFRLNQKVQKGVFTLATEGPLEIIGERSFNVDFGQKDDAEIKFRLRVKDAVGRAKITITGSSGDIRVQSMTDINVVPSSPRIYDKATEKIIKGSSVSMKVPAAGLDGTNNATLDIMLFPDMDFDHRLKWLITYPYGCLEQTTSSVFPQLYLRKMGYFGKEQLAEIDQNINSGINRMQQFLLANGAFSYWPGNSEESEWGTNYAVHFLIEARKLGYSVPDHMYTSALEGMSEAARQHQGELATRVNRSFILALAGQAPMAEMNLLMENEREKLNNAGKWMLAAAYHLSGAANVSDQILAVSGTDNREYDPFSYNFGSRYRDDAIILYCATLMGKTETAELIAKAVSMVLSGKEYLSTQSSGYMLLALGRYFEAIGISASAGQVIAGTVTLANGKKIEFNEKGRFTMSVKESINQTIQISLSNSSNVDQVYSTLSWNGVPIRDESRPMQKNLGLQVNWYDENGNTTNPQAQKQGATIFGRFSVKNTSPVSLVSDLALVQIIPSGWQIENTRLNNTLLPEWTRGWSLNKEEYLDLRDDRVMWFFSLKGDQTLDFVVKLNCVTAGEFWLPGTLLEAMYNNDYRATTEGKRVYVEQFK
jgi:alpha-2-macroglobulin